MLVVMINESSADQVVKLFAGAGEILVPAGESKMVFLDEKETRIINRP